MQYHYMSDKELYHFGRSKKDGAPVGSGRYPLGSGKTRYEQRVTNQMRQDWKDKKYKNRTGAYKSFAEKNTTIIAPGSKKHGSYAHTLTAEAEKQRKTNIAKGVGAGVGIGAAVLGLSIAAARKRYNETGFTTDGNSVVRRVALASAAGGTATALALNHHSKKRLADLEQKYVL